MRRFWYYIAVLFCLLFSCTRPADKGAADAGTVDTHTVQPMAIVQAGEFPLWFQFTAEGPVLIERIEDACFSAALIPWPLAPHVRFMLAHGDELMMAVNRDGFIYFSPQGKDSAAGTGLYRIPGGEFWQRYTVGAFVLFDEKPAALLYRDDRFLDLNMPPPSPRLWTFDRYSANPQTLAMPALDAFSPEDGWDVDALRRGADSRWYFRAVQRASAQPEIRMLCTGDLGVEGEKVSLGVFQNAALPQPLSAAPAALGEMLAAVFAESGTGVAAVVSPEFPGACYFAADREKAAISGFYSIDTFLLAIQSNGAGFYAETKTAASPSIRRFSLPPLPEGFVYTGIGMAGSTIIASWEEQDEYSIGAAGLMMIRL